MVTSVRNFVIYFASLLSLAACKRDKAEIAIIYEQNGKEFRFRAEELQGEVLSWLWDFGVDGDGDVSKAETPKYTYAEHGSYTVSLIGFTLGGFAMEKQTVLTCPPDLTVEYATNCNVVTFSLQEANYTKANVTLDFGDGSPIVDLRNEEGAVFTHTYLDPGNYPVKIEVRPAGCWGVLSWTDTVSVLIDPVAEFDFSVIGLSVDFLNTTVGSSPGWNWQFGDGETSNERNPSHRFTTPGTYYITLSTDRDECTEPSSIHKRVEISDPPNGFEEDYILGGPMGSSNLIKRPYYDYISNGKIIKVFGDSLPIYEFPRKLRADTVTQKLRISWDDETSGDDVTVVISKDRLRFNGSEIANADNAIVWAWQPVMGGNEQLVRYEDGRQVVNGVIQDSGPPPFLTVGKVYYLFIFSKDENGYMDNASQDSPFFVKEP